ncbi:zinc-binding dehydrogenase [Nocardia aurantiaca]|uniref:zinc-binding dehydrogenase n=1 Tax=Nocardia aurantiaca TaxID=2675850 RepID=UPI0018A9095F|nr:zinc-binding dehydrogenase [Nocardia aurantiaca]
MRAGEPREHLRAAGAHIRVAEEERFEGRYDLVFESVGGPIGSRAVAAVAPQGRVVWFGQASDQPLTLDFFSALGAGQGFSLTHFVYSDGDPDLWSDLEHLVGLAARRVVVPHIGSIEDWAEAAGALERIRRGRQPGKAILTIGAPGNSVSDGGAG